MMWRFLILQNVLRFWVDRGVDGFRIDAPKYYFEDKDFRDEPYIPLDVLTMNWSRRPYTSDLNESYELVGDWKKMLEEEYTSKDGKER